MLDLSFTPNSLKIVCLLDLQFRSRFLCAFYMFGSVPFWFCKQNFDWMIRFGQNDKTLLRLVTRLFTTHSRFISSITIYFPHSIPLLFWDLLGFHQGQTYRHSTPLRRFEKRRNSIHLNCNSEGVQQCIVYIFSFFLRWMNFKEFLKRPKTSEISKKKLLHIWNHLYYLAYYFDSINNKYDDWWASSYQKIS